jgi:hypothetical protein
MPIQIKEKQNVLDASARRGRIQFEPAGGHRLATVPGVSPDDAIGPRWLGSRVPVNADVHDIDSHLCLA